MNDIRLLLVDDHKLIIRGLRAIFEDVEGIEIVGEAYNGIEAIDAVKNMPEINMILMDIKMPKLDGINATEEILKLNSDISVIGLSMFEDDDFINRMLNAGAKGYLLKHSTKDELIKAIHQVKKGSVYIGEKTI